MNNYNNYVKRIGGKVYYYIPKSDVICTDQNYLNYVIYIELNDGYLVSSDQFSRRLKKLCGITQQSYFDKYILGISNESDRPKCSNGCGNYVKWSNRITSGYGSGGHLWAESEYHFCCRKCEAEFKSRNPSAYSKLNAFLKSGGAFGMMHNNQDKYGKTGLNDTEIYHKTQRSKFINSGKLTDICSFYIVNTLTDDIKFGIASDLSTRLAFGRSFDEYNDLLFEYKSDRISIAELEYKVKSELGFPKTEYVDKSLLDYIMNIVKSSTTISKESTLKRVEKPSID